MRRRAGFTLIELLVSVVMLGVVMIYLLRSFTVQHKTYTVVDETTEIQQNARAVADLLERDLRHAGLMVPESGAVCGLDATNAPDVLFVSDADAISPGTEKVADFGADLTGTNVATGSQTLVVDGLVAEPAPFRAAYDLDADGVADSDFRELAGVIVTDLAAPARGAACGIVTDIPNATSLVVDILTTPLAAAGTAQLVAIPAHVYQLTIAGQLQRDGIVLAENVDDIQVAYFFDSDEDAIVDANEYRGDDTVDYLAADAAITEDRIREVRVNLVLRTRFEDPSWTQGVFQNAENRVAVAGTDGFRRRVHTATVRLRNVGNRG